MMQVLETHQMSGLRLQFTFPARGPDLNHVTIRAFPASPDTEASVTIINFTTCVSGQSSYFSFKMIIILDRYIFHLK